jgi:hypothetical protein
MARLVARHRDSASSFFGRGGIEAIPVLVR